MSGGVDSSVVAALLARSPATKSSASRCSFTITAKPSGRKGACCAGQDIQDARRVAQMLGIPHYVLDYEKRFADAVMNSFAESYISGETPIPCVTCNQKIKFRDLLATARELGADVAGHRPLHSALRTATACRRSIRAARRRSRPELFPVRHDARAARSTCGFRSATCRRARCARSRASSACRSPTSPTARTSASCRRAATATSSSGSSPGALKPGDIVHVDGRRLGRHDGIINYTIGQRRGLRIAAGEAAVRRSPQCPAQRGRGGTT